MKLLTKKIRADLLKAGDAATETGESGPVLVKFFTPDANATWLVTDATPWPDNPRDLRLFGLADLGDGQPEICYFMLSDIESIRGAMGLPVERDRWFTPNKSLADYAEEARARGHVYA